MDAILKTEGLGHTYSAGTPFEKTAISGIDVSVYPGELMCLIGHTGSGKSTFIQHLNGLLKPSTGRVLFEGEDIFRSREATRDVRHRVGLVFQYPEYQLFEETVYKDIAFGPRNMGQSREEIDESVCRAAEFVGVGRELFERSPLELSGGQKRRVAIAGVIAMNPRVLILDEPTAGLDPGGCGEIMGNILDYKKAAGSTVVLVTHDMDAAARVADRLIVFDGGRVAMDGAPDAVFAREEELLAMGLDVPAPTAIAKALRERGVPVPKGIYTLDALRRAINAIRKGGAPHA